MTSTISFILSNVLLVSSAFAQELDPATCLPGEVCGQAAVLGSWGLIALGLLSWMVALIPPRDQEEARKSKGIWMLSGLQVRIEKETTGWRRFQWPLLGLVSIGLGAANLLGWL